MRLYLLLVLPTGALCLFQPGKRMDVANPLPARRTSIGDGFGFVKRESPAPTAPPRIRFRNAHLDRRASENTCGFLVNSAEIAAEPQALFCPSTTCMTSGSYIGCSPQPYTACYDGSAGICRTGTLGPGTRCWYAFLGDAFFIQDERKARPNTTLGFDVTNNRIRSTASTSGWQPQCVNWRMENPDGEMTYIGCYNTMLSGLNTNSIFLVTDTSLLPNILLDR
ncbi:hypothetical protein RB213_002565 [Colletotrichum asianum]